MAVVNAIPKDANYIWDQSYVVLQTQEKQRLQRHRNVRVWLAENERRMGRRQERNFVAFLDLVEPLNLRDAFCGKRTNAVKLYPLADIASGEKINYYDCFVNQIGVSS